MAVLMKYIYQNRRGVNSNFFSSLILFSFLFIYHFWNDVSGHTSIWFVKMSRVLHSFLSLEKIFPPTLTFEHAGSSSCNFRCGFTRMSDSTCIASVPRYFTQFLTRMNRWLSIYTYNCFHFNLEFLNES